MLSNSVLYRIWRQRLSQLIPESCKYHRYRLTNMLLLVVGLYKAQSVHLNLIARKLPIRARKLSLERRLRRFMDNGAIRVREWHRPIAAALLKAASSGGQVHLLIDSTKVSARHRLLMVGIAYRRRALPLAWTWVRTNVGHSTARKQLALLSYVHSLIPPGTRVSLAGDSEFGSVELLRQLDAWRWEYALRQRGMKRFLPYRTLTLYRLDRQKLEPDEKWWLGRVQLTYRFYMTNLVVYRARGEPEPWCLATNLPSPHGAIMLYRRRMWLEEMFGDMKGHGFNLEATRLGTILRLTRLTTIQTHPDGGDWVERVLTIGSEVARVLAETRPYVVALEDYAYARGQRAHQAGELGGKLREVLCDLPITETSVYLVAPAALKKFATGRGNASKTEVAVAAARRWGIDFAGDDNAYDAYCLARIAAALDGHDEGLTQFQQEVLDKIRRANP